MVCEKYPCGYKERMLLPKLKENSDERTEAPTIPPSE